MVRTRRDRQPLLPETRPGRGSEQRRLRLGEELRHALAQLLRPGECRDPALFEADITVSEVMLSPDLRNATAYVMPLAGAHAGEIMAGLARSTP
jgi:ribosome-binding factor A